jgi:hypothetical protein
MKVPQSSYSRSAWVITPRLERQEAGRGASLSARPTLIKLNYSVNIVILNILGVQKKRGEGRQRKAIYFI